jgi:hypothetical protein
MWDVEGTDAFADWYDTQLDATERGRVEAAIEYLQERGPGLGRPWVDSLKGTRLKELIPRGGFLRILFRFDPRQTAILLIGGSKEGRWERWYEEMILVGEVLYEAYLAELHEEGLLE